MGVHLLAVAGILLLSTSGCDQLSQDRYELSKDQSGRTLRLDKKTGEISVIAGDRIVSLRDAKEDDSLKNSEETLLRGAKTHPRITVSHLGIDAGLRTSWQDGKVYYSVDFRPLSPKPADSEAKPEAQLSPSEFAKAKPKPKGNLSKAAIEKLRGSVSSHRYFLLLSDVPFELAREQLSFSEVVNDDGSTARFEAKGNFLASRDLYKRIDSWNINWQKLF